MKKVNDFDLIEVSRIISNPFSREIHISEIKEEYGNGFFIFYDMGNGIAVFIRNFVPSTDFILIEHSEISGASLIFNLASDIKFVYKDTKEYVLKRQHFFLELASDKFSCEISIKKDEPFISFLICIKEELFLKLAHPIVNIEANMKQASKKSYNIFNSLKTDTLQSELFNDFKDREHFEDILSSIYLESRTTNLLHYSIEKVANALNENTKKYNKDGLLSLQRAKEIIMQEYSSKLSIKNIAYKSAINECYLKKDFKEYYGMTILEMLQKRRLEVAKKLLKDDFSVKEVAFKIGYKNSSHFSKLFFQHFSITPNNYKKQFSHL